MNKFLIILILSISGAVSGETEEEKQEKREFQMYKCMKQEHALAACCNLPHMNKEAGMKCVDHLKKNQKIAVYCFTECIYQEKGMFNAEGTIDKDKLIASNDEFFFEHQKEDLKKTFHDAILACLAECEYPHFLQICACDFQSDLIIFRVLQKPI
jgi:hypothetical protein